MGKPTGSYPNRIKEFRQRVPRGEGVTQYSLAAALHITQPAFNALEQGKVPLTPKKAMILAPLLHCEPWELSKELEDFMNFGKSKSRAVSPVRKKKTKR